MRYMKFESTTPTPTAVPEITIPTSMSEATRMFLLDRERKGLSKWTITNYKHSLKNFPQDLWPLTPAALNAWLLHCQTVGYAPSSVSGRLVGFRTFWAWLRKRGLVDVEDPSRFIESIKVPKQQPRIPTPDEVRALLKATPKLGTPLTGKRFHAMIRVFIDTAIRLAELTALRWQDVDWEQGQITIWHGKGDKFRIVPFSHGTARILRNWCDDSPDNRPADFIFPYLGGGRMNTGSVYNGLNSLSHLAAVGWSISPHKLRHYAATEMLRHEMGLEELRLLLGHSSLKVTERYLHLAGVDIKKAHRRASPGDWLDRHS